MTDYREIIRLKSLEFSNVAIANSLGCSRNTVSEVLRLAETHSLDGLSLMHCQTLTSSICFTRTEAIMKEGGSRILSIFTTSLPNPV